MASRPVLRHSIAFFAALAGLAAIAWSLFVDLETGLGEAVRVGWGLAALWGPIGGVVYLCLRGRVVDPLTRAVLAGAASYAFTAPLYGLFSLGALWLPGADRMFYVVEASLVAGALYYVWANRGREKTGAAIGQRQRRFDAILLLLVGLSMLATPRYKQPFAALPDGSRRLITHGDVTYLAAQCYELARRAPAAQQSMRAGIKERAYHTYPHLTTMLVARYTGQEDMLRALMHYEFSAVEVFLCLLIYCTVRDATGSRWAGYLALSLTFLAAIPLPPVVPNGLGYFYFTWHTHATSNLEGAIICSPQMYCALPVVFGAMLCALQISINLRRGLPLGALALILALMAAVMLRFRVQVFLLLLPNALLLLAIAWRRTGQRRLLAAGLAGVAVAAFQVAEMRLPLYYPETCDIVIRTTNIMHTWAYFSAWPGAEPLRAWLQSHAGPAAFKHGWQISCAAMFAMLNMIGLPVLLPAVWSVCRRETWRSEAWAFVGLVLWLTIGSVIGATCVGSKHDHYSVGGQMLLMTGWYALPLAVVGLWQMTRRLPERWPWLGRLAPACGLALAVIACGWQRIRDASPLQNQICAGAALLSRSEWEAIEAMRSGLPQDAVLLSKNTHHHPFVCMFSGVVGRRTYLEYLIDGHFTGPPDERNPARLARIDRVWRASEAEEFAAAMLETGATHVVEYGYLPLAAHPPQCLQPFWSSPDGAVTVWKFRPSPAVARRAHVAAHPAPRSPFHAL